MDIKKIVLLGRRDQAEAMRVAAGLTIFGHEVRLVFMGREVADTADNREQAELLELPHLSEAALMELCLEADAVLSL
jgi:1,4-alpha-glucan branching enzyme